MDIMHSVERVNQLTFSLSAMTYAGDLPSFRINSLVRLFMDSGSYININCCSTVPALTEESAKRVAKSEYNTYSLSKSCMLSVYRS